MLVEIAVFAGWIAMQGQDRATGSETGHGEDLHRGLAQAGFIRAL